MRVSAYRGACQILHQFHNFFAGRLLGVAFLIARCQLGLSRELTESTEVIDSEPSLLTPLPLVKKRLPLFILGGERSS
jgi:hypothetical protein